MSVKGRRFLIGAACVFVTILSLSVLLSSPKKLSRHAADLSAFDKAAFAEAMLRRGMIDAASHRFERAKRAFDAARRAASNDPDLRARINAEAAKLER